MRATRTAETSSSNDAWKERELRVLVVCSLALQIVLICLGKRRKYVCHYWIRGATWSAYLLADTVAIYTLGKIAGTMVKTHQEKLAGKMDPHTELSTFWAPFLLLHLGGPDTITANALEDNELWLRHLLYLLNQTGITLYILVMSWTGTSLSIVAFLMMFSGLFKYVERVWALRAASNKQFKNSVTDSRPKLSNKILETYQLKKAEGYDVIPHKVTEIREVRIPKDLVTDLSSEENDSSLSPEQLYKRNQGELVAAKGLANTFQGLFGDLLFSSGDRDTSFLLLKNKHCDVAFKIIEIELSLIYDLFYTKAKVIYSYSRFICRLISFFFICVALVVLSFSDMRQYSRMDLGVTFLLVGGAIFLEIYALCDLLFSDRVAVWLIDRKSLTILNFITWVLPLHRQRRWSNSIGQCRLVSFSIKQENLPCRSFLRLSEAVVKHLNVERHEELTMDLKAFVMKFLREKKEPKFPWAWTDRGGSALVDDKDKNLGHLKWSVELEFEISILVWHLATEICCHQTRKGNEYIAMPDIQSRMLICEHLSRYMMFLLVCYPSMLPMGIESVRFQDVCEELSRFFKQHKFDGETNGNCIGKRQRWFWGCWSCPERRDREVEINACDLLRIDPNSKLNLSVIEADKAKYVLCQGRWLAAEIEKAFVTKEEGTTKEKKNEQAQWETISKVWVEMLLYAANKCGGRSHAQQMIRGGEFITHVWFLMAHFGFTDHFQVEQAPLLAELVVSPKFKVI